LVKGRDEDHRRHVGPAYGFEHAEAVHLRHLYIQKYKIRSTLPDGRDGILGILAFSDDFNVALGREQPTNSPASQFLVVHYQGPNFCRSRHLVPVGVAAQMGS